MVFCSFCFSFFRRFFSGVPALLALRPRLFLTAVQWAAAERRSVEALRGQSWWGGVRVWASSYSWALYLSISCISSKVSQISCLQHLRHVLPSRHLSTDNETTKLRFFAHSSDDVTTEMTLKKKHQTRTGSFLMMGKRQWIGPYGMHDIEWLEVFNAASILAQIFA